jgi:hypothetical protein
MEGEVERLGRNRAVPFDGLFYSWSDMRAVENCPPHFVSTFEPYTYPRYVHHLVRGLAPVDRGLYCSVLGSIRSMQPSPEHRLPELIGIRDEFSRKFDELERIIQRTLGGVKGVIVVWIAGELHRFEAMSESTAERWRQVVLKEAHDVWRRFVEARASDWAQMYWEVDPAESMSTALWRMAEAAVATSTDSGLRHYLQMLTPLWQRAARLDIKRYAYDACINALLHNEDIPLDAPKRRPLPVLHEAQNTPSVGNPAFWANRTPEEKRFGVLKLAEGLIDKDPHAYVSSRWVLTNALRDEVAEQTGLPESTVADILRPILKENIDALRALLDEDDKES